MNFKTAISAFIAFSALAMGTAHANTFALTGLPTGEIVNPGSFSSTFVSSAADSAATMNFVLEGYRTLDGSSPSANWDDLFTLNLNNVTIGTGYFKIGGGGDSSWSGTGTWVCTTCALAQTNTGGLVTFSNVALNVLAGVNTVQFVYSAPEAPAGEGFANEAWSINSAAVTSSAVISAVPEPETYAMLLAGLGLIGTIARRRSAKNSA